MTNELESKLRLIASSVRTDGEVYLYLRRDVAGGVFDFYPVFADTIEPLFTEDGRLPQPPSPAYRQVIEGRPVIALTTDELIRIGPKGLTLEQAA